MTPTASSPSLFYNLPWGGGFHWTPTPNNSWFLGPKLSEEERVGGGRGRMIPTRDGRARVWVEKNK